MPDSAAREMLQCRAGWRDVGSRRLGHVLLLWQRRDRCVRQDHRYHPEDAEQYEAPFSKSQEFPHHQPSRRILDTGWQFRVGGP